MTGYILKEKIRIGISACNFGSQVRYNQRGWDRVGSLGRIKGLYTWTPVCPEVLSGLGVPRDPVKLVNGNGFDFWKGQARLKNRKGKTVSEQVKEGTLNVLNILKRANIDAFAFMEGSPSCGVYRTTLKEKRLGRPPGVFGALLLQEDLFLIPVLDMESPWKWWDWQRRLHAFVWLKKMNITGKKELYEIWHQLKFMCQEVSDAEARSIGTDIAGAPKRLESEYIDAWKSRVLRLLRSPSELKRIYNVMAKHSAHYRKYFGLKAAGAPPTSRMMGKQQYIEELERFERKAVEQNYVFGGHPVIYKPEVR